MSVSGAQDFWVVGSRAYFKKTGSNPWRDLGIVQTVTPNLTTESIELEDPDGGVKTTADKQVTKVTENYDLTLSNLSLRNLSMMFLADDPSDLSVTAAEVSHTTTETYVGELVQILDVNSEPVRMTKVAGIHLAAATTVAGDITAIDVSARQITVTTDQSAVLADGDQIIVAPDGLADPTNCGTYTVDGTPSATVITVKEDFLGVDESAVTVDLIHDAGTPGDVYDLGTDWAVANEDRGLVKLIDGGAMATDATSVIVVYWQYAISGLRTTIPQANTTIEGELRVIFSRDTFASETERYIPKVKVTPGSTNFQVDDYSNFVLNFEVVSDDTKTNTVGHLKHYKGTVPSKS